MCSQFMEPSLEKMLVMVMESLDLNPTVKKKSTNFDESLTGV